MGKKVDLTLFAKRVNEQYPLEFAVLFGSRARGDALKSSDYDILFVSDHFPKDVFGRMSKILGLWDFECGIEPICYTTAEFRDGLHKINAIVWESLKDGKPIFGADEFSKYQKILLDAIKSGDVVVRNGGSLKFNKLPEEIADAAGI
jgi:hypothetical protein